MIKVNLVCVGKLKERYWRDACAEYQKRLSRFCDLTIRELPEKTVAAEGEDVLRAARGRLFALAVEGKQLSSEEFAETCKGASDRGEELTFAIGSSEGLSPAVKARAELLSFSRLTFPHQMFRVVFLEQLYRAFMINAGAEYHK